MAPTVKSPNIVPFSSTRGWLAPSGKLRLGLPDALKGNPPGAMSGPEAPLSVAYVGLNDSEQQLALASFPGARRCTLVPNLCRPVPLHPMWPKQGN